MADYSTLYPTLTRSKSGQGTYGAPIGSGTGSLSGLDLGTGIQTSGNTGLNLGDMGGSGPWALDDSAGGGGSGWTNQKTGKLIGAAAPLLLSLFAPGDDANVPGAIKHATQAADALGTQADRAGAQGADVLGPVLHYLAAIQSGDPQALLQATMPERRKVIDQYDTARQQAQFAPRGGGTSSAIVNANTREAGDLAAIGGKARTDALSMGAQLGSSLTGVGLQGKSASVSHLTQLLDPLMKNKQNDQQEIFKTFSSIAGMIGLFV